MSTPSDTPPVKRLNLQLPHDADSMLREIAEATGLKLVRIIVNGIRAEHKRWKAEAKP